MKIGQMERECVEKSVRIGLQIVIDDLIRLEKEEEQEELILMNNKKMKISSGSSDSSRQ